MSKEGIKSLKLKTINKYANADSHQILRSSNSDSACLIEENELRQTAIEVNVCSVNWPLNFKKEYLCINKTLYFAFV